MRHVNRVVLSLLIILSTVNAYAFQFNKQHYLVIQDIIWAADKVDVPRELMLALCWGESSFRTDKNLNHMDHGSISYGTCQVKLETALWMDRIYHHKVKATAIRLQNVKINAFYAAKYLQYQLVRYDGDWSRAVDAYNAGSAQHTQRDTKYVRKVKRNTVFIEKHIQLDIRENEAQKS